MMICKLKTCVIVSGNELFADDYVHTLPLSVLDFVNLPSPKGAITGAYGNDGIRVLKVTLARELDFTQLCQEVEFSVLRDVEASRRITSEMLKDVNTLNLLRLTVELVNIINVFWRKFFIGSIPENEQNFPRTATKRPDLIERLHDCEMFKHIDLFIYPVDLGDNILVVGSYFKPEGITEIQANSYINGKFTFPPVSK